MDYKDEQSDRIKKTFTSDGKRFSVYFKNSPDWITQDSVVDRKMNEPKVTRYMLRNLKSGMIFLDVGAAVGWFTLIGAHMVGSGGKVLAYEPMPSRFKLLKENIRLNGFETVSCFPLALSDKDGEAYMEGPGMMRVTEKRTDTSIKTVRFDSHVGGLNLGRVDIVKIDVEGAELRVLYGMRKMIENNPEIKIVCEVHKGQMRRYGDNWAHLSEFMSKMGLTGMEIGGHIPHWVFSHKEGAYHPSGKVPRLFSHKNKRMVQQYFKRMRDKLGL